MPGGEMRILTPTEYADAYQYMQQQDTRRHTVEVEDLLTPHLIRVAAEHERLAAVRRHWDTPQLIAQRRADLLADQNISRSIK